VQSSNQNITTNKPTPGFLQAGCLSCHQYLESQELQACLQVSTSRTSRPRDELSEVVQQMFLNGVSCLRLAAEAGKACVAGLRHQRTRKCKVFRQLVGRRLGKQRNKLLVVECPYLIKLHELFRRTASRLPLPNKPV